MGCRVGGGMADAADLKSAGVKPRVGSNPTRPTFFFSYFAVYWRDECFGRRWKHLRPRACHSTQILLFGNVRRLALPNREFLHFENGAALQKSKCGPDSGPEQLNSGSRQSALPRLPKFDKLAALEGN